MIPTMKVYILVYRNKLSSTNRVGAVYGSWEQARVEQRRLEASGYNTATIIEREMELP